MALPPTIPTSFVPHTQSSVQRKFRFDFISAFSFVAYIILAVVVGMAVGVYLYGQFLLQTREGKTAKLVEAEKSIDHSIAEGFVRLHDRLTASQELLNGHTAYSQFFTTVGELLPTTVRFSSMRLTQGENMKVTLDGTGVAKNFNALAAASASLAASGKIKDAIFSHIAVNKDNSVTFTLAAVIDPALIAYEESTAAPAPAPISASTTSPL